MRIAKAGWPFILGCLFIGAVIAALAHVFECPFLGILAGLSFLGACFCVYFFRNPFRRIPRGEHLILSPADGKIMEIVEGTDPVSTQPVWILRIFLSVFNVHIQRAPVAGRVQAVRYKTGRFLDARDPKACFENEQNRMEFVPDGRFSSPLVVTQIAGLIARRIVCWVREGQRVAAGELIGLIRFGSQVDLVIPKSVQLKVKTGDRVKGGSSVMAEVLPE
ncbi:MAG: phosphatidylserine decarboxylase [Elusimicrobiota bacterium]|jgi:phosphatidylserine decarboxylase